ncbi:hypothetical protein FA15DRAFT_710186 [Coprinopsis marcescibilis]|uniref:Uncharacterized protein n=1 Tax=Coprinopsis marcescibilis TaxID=230819 RepID=A0A5C3KEM6_COPMA|nr:hypothetical protein FA15DRAFT_710186 [Coprinopsis marcescibilis]
MKPTVSTSEFGTLEWYPARHVAGGRLVEAVTRTHSPYTPSISYTMGFFTSSQKKAEKKKQQEQDEKIKYWYLDLSSFVYAIRVLCTSTKANIESLSVATDVNICQTLILSITREYARTAYQCHKLVEGLASHGLGMTDFPMFTPFTICDASTHMARIAELLAFIHRPDLYPVAKVCEQNIMFRDFGYKKIAEVFDSSVERRGTIRFVNAFRDSLGALGAHLDDLASIRTHSTEWDSLWTKSRHASEREVQVRLAAIGLPTSSEGAVAAQATSVKKAVIVAESVQATSSTAVRSTVTVAGVPAILASPGARVVNSGNVTSTVVSGVGNTYGNNTYVNSYSYDPSQHQHGGYGGYGGGSTYDPSQYQHQQGGYGGYGGSSGTSYHNYYN